MPILQEKFIYVCIYGFFFVILSRFMGPSVYPMKKLYTNQLKNKQQ